MPVIELRRTKRTKPASRVLQNFASNVTSQYGEDGLIAEIFRRSLPCRTHDLDVGNSDSRLKRSGTVGEFQLATGLGE